MTSQGWGLYESGKRPGLFRPDVQRRLTGALDATPEDLALILAREAPPASAPADRRRKPPTAPSTRPALYRPARPNACSFPTTTSPPGPPPGVVLEFDPGRWPRRDQGCVIDLTDGARLVRLYQRADGDRLYVKGGPAGLDIETSLDRTDRDPRRRRPRKARRMKRKDCISQRRYETFRRSQARSRPHASLAQTPWTPLSDARIGDRRAAVGLSQTALAQRLGRQPQQVQKYEAGQNRISASRLNDSRRHWASRREAFFRSERRTPSATTCRTCAS